MLFIEQIKNKIEHARYGIRLGEFHDKVRRGYGKRTTYLLEIIEVNAAIDPVHAVGDQLYGSGVVDAHLDALIERVAAGRRSGQPSD